MLNALEDDSKQAACQPKQMRPFQSNKSDKVVAPSNDPPPAVDVSNHDDEDDDSASPSESPRNSVLSKLAMRVPGRISKPRKPAGKKFVMYCVLCTYNQALFCCVPITNCVLSCCVCITDCVVCRPLPVVLCVYNPIVLCAGPCLS